MVRELSSVVETLQTVQRARKRFLELWSVENAYINPMLDRMADDLARVTSGGCDEDDNDSEQGRAPSD